MRSTTLLYKILLTANLVKCKPAIYTFLYRRCFYKKLTYLERNAVFQFCRTNCTHLLIRKSKHPLPLQTKSQNWPHQYKTFAWREFHNVGTVQSDGFSAKTLKNFQNHLYSHSVLILLTSATFAVRAGIVKQHNKEFINLILHSVLLLCVIECNP